MLFNGLSSVIQFIVFDRLDLPYASLFFAVGLVGSIVGVQASRKLSDRLDSSAVFIAPIVLLVAGATIMTLVVGVESLIGDFRSDAGGTWAFHGVCAPPSEH